MFKEVLRDIVEKTDGGIAGLLMDTSGIAVDSYAVNDAPFDIGTVGAELSVVLKQISKASEMLEAGQAQEISVNTERMITVIRAINTEYYLALAMHPNGNFGKGRFLMRTAAPKLLAEL
jgi:predicted regulator of Ras-like GTPase activity (Roadblock/LC7/MglB family)